jgi:protein-S-isoprenylcysteine O-methyltransferase Ste14
MARKRTHGEGHQERDDLTGEHTAGDTGQLILACIFAVVWIVDTSFLNWTTFVNSYVPLYVRIPCGVLLLSFAGILARKGLSIVFGEKREVPGVIREGVFRIVRHPVYLGEILLYLGLIMLSISLAALAVWIVAVVFLHRISRYEERLLLDRFGDDYKRYMGEVPMWVPRFGKRRM